VTETVQPSYILKGARSAVKKFEDILARLDFVQGIDEIAFAFACHGDLEEFIHEMVQHPDVTHFNAAHDHVHTLPLRTCYGVRYEFLKVEAAPDPLCHEFRIEAMSLTNGYSPLHLAELRGVDYKPIAVHASFKVEDEIDYGIAVNRLREAGWEAAQRCESNYGRFSYWTPLAREEWLPDGPFMYLKPRVNTRDQKEALA
jgi:hypothetical protein